MPSQQAMSFDPEPDLHPLYPTSLEVSRLLSSNSGLTPAQKHTLITHCMTRACIFADIQLLQYIIHDPHAAAFIDLDFQDEDGLVYASVIILGFGAESDRDVEREECVRLLIAEGANINIPDKAGWTPLHHAAVLAPPTLISHLLTHGCSPLSVTRRNMTALDIVTAYSVIPGREDVALFLEEAMRGEGWQESRMSLKRQVMNERMKENNRRLSERSAIQRILELDQQWWGLNADGISSEETAEDERDIEEVEIYTPPLDYSTMLVFSPASLPRLFDTLIMDVRPSIRNAEPANALYMLARFACLACDHTWVEELIMGATDAIEDVAFTHPDDLTYTIFWLYNCTIWLHLMHCDASISETCELLGFSDVIEEVMNTVYVLIIRVAERRIDKLIDPALLDYSPSSSELDAVQFESEWSLFRSPFSSKKKIQTNLTPSNSASLRSSPRPSSPSFTHTSRPSSPNPQTSPLSTPKPFSSIRQSFNRARAGSSISSLQNLFNEGPSTVDSPDRLIGFLSALQTLLSESGINPAIITQLWSQTMYWTASEVFNRILTRKRYICRSRAHQIGMNLALLEDWIDDVGLPPGVKNHFAPARDLVMWLQCLSSMNDFSHLIATIQSLKHLNPLQMRRAVRDYRYEVSESRMSDDCSQYLVQLQKDWERQRVSMGVEALRKEINDRDKEYDDDTSSNDSYQDGATPLDRSFSTSSVETAAAQNNIDLLFDRNQSKAAWKPPRPPEVLGELLESRYMLPLLLPSDPRHLSVVYGQLSPTSSSPKSVKSTRVSNGRSRSRSPKSPSCLEWVSASRRMRQVKVDLLDKLDGNLGLDRWSRRSTATTEDDELVQVDNSESASETASSIQDAYAQDQENSHVRLTRMARAPSSRSRHGRNGTG